MRPWEYTWERIWWKVDMFSGHYELKHGDQHDKHSRSRLEGGVTLKDKDVWDYINNLGKEGWELVSVVPETRGLSTNRYMLWFKRPISS